MIRFRNFLPVAALLVGVAILAAPTQANAAFTLTLNQTGFGSVTITDGDLNDQSPLPGVITYNVANYGTFTDLEITIRSNAPGTTTGIGSSVRDITLTTRNSSGTAATLDLTAFDDTFTIPSGNPLLMRSSLSSDLLEGGNLASGEVAKGEFTSTFISGTTTSSPTITLTGPGAGVNFTTVPRNLAGFTLTNHLAVTLGGGGQANFTGSTSVTVPAPPSLLLLAGALPVFGVARLLRRRKQA